MDKDEIVKALVALIAKGENPDSLEIGSASKGGVVKIYCNFENIEATKLKIDRAFEARDYANTKMPHKE
jgi:hypothetical protein